MSPSSRALLVRVLVLCALEDAVRSQRARCAGNQCVAFFQEPEDFAGAQTRCNVSGGQLYTLGQEHVGGLVPVRGGSYWVQLPSGDPAGPPSCAVIYVSTGGVVEQRRAPCLTRNAFLCQYTLEEPCSGLQPGAGALVTYTTKPTNFMVDDSDAFPPGTIAVTMQVGDLYMDSKHLCAFRIWRPAPWSCEVMRGGCEHHCDNKTCTCPPGKVLHRNNINCTCGHGFKEEDGACVSVAICNSCEYKCDKVDGVYQCVCRKGFRVAARDPTKCEAFCEGKVCLARCDRNNPGTCTCPDGYILDPRDGQTFCADIDECAMKQCHHDCENLLGGYRCWCRAGFTLTRDGSTCVRVAGELEGDGSGSSPPPPLPPLPLHPSPAAVPSYVKTGSVLGIGVFALLVALLLFFLIRHAATRCGRFELTSIKHRDVDIFCLQQETYRPFRGDS